MKLTPYSS